MELSCPFKRHGTPATCHRRQQTLINKDRRKQPHAADVSLGSVSSTVPEDRSVVSLLPSSAARGHRGRESPVSTVGTIQVRGA